MKNTKIGLCVENDIIDHINKNKFITNMNDNISSFLKEIFNSNLIGVVIKAYKYYENYKPDIVIYAKSEKRYISIKTGRDNSVHQEHIHSFCNFLSESGISDTVIKYLKLFHFNDTTINGSGYERFDSYNFYSKEKNICETINNELNKKKTIYSCVKRILFEGEYYNIPSVDFIYHGTLENGVWASKEQILDYLINKKINSFSIHISKLYYQALQRNLQYKTGSEFRRYYVQFKWHSIESDLKVIKSK